MSSSTQFTIYTNADEVVKNIDKRIKRLQKGSKSITREVAKFGKTYAQQIAPMDTGATIRAISWTKGKTPSSASVIFGEGAHTPDRQNKIMGKYGLTTYMNFIATKNIWHTGNWHFINATEEEVKKRFNTGMRRMVVNAIR